MYMSEDVYDTTQRASAGDLVYVCTRRAWSMPGNDDQPSTVEHVETLKREGYVIDEHRYVARKRVIGADRIPAHTACWRDGHTRPVEARTTIVVAPETSDSYSYSRTRWTFDCTDEAHERLMSAIAGEP